MNEIVPEGWSVDRLDELTNLITKGTTPKSYFNDGINFIKVESISSSRTLIPEKFSKIDFNTHESQKRSQLKCGDILFGIAGSLGRLAVVKERDLPANTNQALAIIRLRQDSIDRDFCLQQLSADKIQLEIKNLQTVGAQPNLSLQQVSDFELYTPPLPEQKKIASILTSVDEVIENTQKQIDKLQDLKKATMNELLTKGIGHTQFKDSELGRIPQSWEVKSLVEIAKVIDCKHRTPVYRSKGYPVVRPRDVKVTGIEFDNCVLVNEEDFNDLNENHKPSVGDTVYSRNATFGIGAYVEHPLNFAIGQDVCVISPRDISPRFLYLSLNSEGVYTQVLNEMSGSTFKRINLGSIKTLRVVVPAYAEQTKIETILLAIEQQLIQREKKLRGIQSLKKSLMQDLLTGKVRVTV